MCSLGELYAEAVDQGSLTTLVDEMTDLLGAIAARSDPALLAHIVRRLTYQEQRHYELVRREQRGIEVH